MFEFAKGATVYLNYDSPCHNPQFPRSGLNLTPSDYRVVIYNEEEIPRFVKPTKVERALGESGLWEVWFEYKGHKWYGSGHLRCNVILLRCEKVIEEAQPFGNRPLMDEKCADLVRFAQANRWDRETLLQWVTVTWWDVARENKDVG